MLRCDLEGIPSLVQRIDYNADTHSFLCEMFDGRYIRVSGNDLHDSELYKEEVTPLHYFEVEEHAINYYHFTQARFWINDRYRKYDPKLEILPIQDNYCQEW